MQVLPVEFALFAVSDGLQKDMIVSDPAQLL